MSTATDGGAATLRDGGFGRVAELIRTKGLRFADFWFTDIGGRPWRITMPADAVDEELFERGLPLDGQPVGGAWDGVMILHPRPGSVYPDPSASAPTLAMFCDVLDPATRKPLATEPRHVVSRAIRLAEEKLGAQPTIGVEPEFMLLDGRGRVVSESVLWEFLRALALSLSDAGIQVDWFRYGPAPGQGRVQMRAGCPLRLADQTMLYRHVAMNLARGRGLCAAFLPKPVAGEGAPGMPLHLALWKDGRNLFHDDAGWALTSPLCRAFAGGLLAHLPALLGVCAPTTNSYRRLVAGHAGPTEALLSVARKEAACRIPARSTAPGARRVKFCCPDSTANPYLAFAAVIAAGVDGALRAVEAPCDGAPAAPARLPHSLEAALEALDADRGFLVDGGVFDAALVDAWLKERWIKHVMPVRSLPHPWELAHTEQFGRPAVELGDN